MSSTASLQKLYPTQHKEVNAKLAAESRAILARYGIDINSAANGVYLPTTPGVSNAMYHPGLHTNAYYSKVNDLLRTATNKSEVLDILNYIADALLNGTF